MDLAAISTLVDRRYREIVEQILATTEDQIGTFFTIADSDSFEERVGTIGELPLWETFTGTIPYSRFYEQYNVVATHREFVQGLRFERTAMEDDLTNILRGEKYQRLTRSGILTRQYHAAGIISNAASNDMTFYSRSEGVPLASDAHLTRTPGVSTAVGFDNLTLSGLSQVAYRAARIQMRHFANDQGHIMNMSGDGLVVPIDLEPRAMEILQTDRQLDSDYNNINPERGTAEIIVLIRWNDVNDWALVNKSMMKQCNTWYDRRPLEFASVMDFDSQQMKARGTGRWSYMSRDWRWLLYGSVT